ncbi:MAG TPA: helix-turn-helix transcriptional regulator [Tepidisphaeraceae bacterium]|nr:helix-turn-helix transcriptional regulator [Tepidisphaeraceae bacterium]
MPKAQHAPAYSTVPALLREMREAAELTQRQVAAKLRRPQSWVYNCETANRRVDVTEFVAWCRACGIDPLVGMAKLLNRSR